MLCEAYILTIMDGETVCGVTVVDEARKIAAEVARYTGGKPITHTVVDHWQFVFNVKHWNKRSQFTWP